VSTGECLASIRAGHSLNQSIEAIVHSGMDASLEYGLVLSERGGKSSRTANPASPSWSPKRRICAHQEYSPGNRLMVTKSLPTGGY